MKKLDWGTWYWKLVDLLALYDRTKEDGERFLKWYNLGLSPEQASIKYKRLLKEE